jgi:hypothetical protein
MFTSTCRADSFHANVSQLSSAKSEVPFIASILGTPEAVSSSFANSSCRLYLEGAN